jgi:flagellar M-ring protein FliF
MLKKFNEAPALPAPGHQAGLEMAGAAGMMALPPGQRNYAENLSRAQKLANEDPRVVANIVKTWVSSNE